MSTRRKSNRGPEVSKRSSVDPKESGFKEVVIEKEMEDANKRQDQLLASLRSDDPMLRVCQDAIFGTLLRFHTLVYIDEYDPRAAILQILANIGDEENSGVIFSAQYPKEMRHINRIALPFYRLGTRQIVPSFFSELNETEGLEI